MSNISEAFLQAGEFMLSKHAKERIRQRIGIASEQSALAWVQDAVRTAKGTRVSGHQTHYLTDAFEIICDGVKVVTVKQTDSSNEYLTKFSEVISKEAGKLLSKYQQELRKADIEVAQLNLNFLRAKNPNTKAIISERMTEAIDYKAMIEDEIGSIKYASRRYGV